MTTDDMPDLHGYVHAIDIPAERAKALMIQLEKAAPTDIDLPERDALSYAHVLADEIDDALREQAHPARIAVHPKLLVAYVAALLELVRMWWRNDRRLDDLDESMKAKLIELAGGEAIGESTRAVEAPPRHAKRQQFARALGAYLRMLAAKVRRDDARSIARFRSAVAPMFAHRVAHGRRDAERPSAGR